MQHGLFVLQHTRFITVRGSVVMYCIRSLSEAQQSKKSNQTLLLLLFEAKISFGNNVIHLM